MRRLLITAALAAAAAAPAAAQTEADLFAAEVMQRLAANQAGVRDYSFTLVWRSTRLPIYVHQAAGAWQVEVPEDESPVADLMEAAVLWPTFSSLDQEADEGKGADPWGQYLDYGMDRDTAQGRPVRVLFAHRTGEGPGSEALPDSFSMYVDEASGQIVRVRMSGVDEEESGPDAQIGRVDATLDWMEYEATDGLILPRRLRLRMLMEVQISAKERQSMREDLARAQAEAATDDSPESVQMREILELVEPMLTGGELEVEMRMEEVRVNPGPPAWLDRPGKG